MPLCSRLLGSINLLVMPSWSPFAAFEHLEGTTCNPVLHESHHYRKTNNCRVSRPLPSARPRALGKHDLCRVPAKGHSANTWHMACPNFAESWPSAKYGTRQTLLFAECHRARTRQRPRTCPARAPAVCRP